MKFGIISIAWIAQMVEQQSPKVKGSIPPLEQNSFSNIIKNSQLLEKEFCLRERIEFLSLRIINYCSTIWAIQAIDIKHICNIKIKMCSNKYFTEFNDNFLLWGSCRHHLWLIYRDPWKQYSLCAKKTISNLK